MIRHDEDDDLMHPLERITNEEGECQGASNRRDVATLPPGRGRRKTELSVPFPPCSHSLSTHSIQLTTFDALSRDAVKLDCVWATEIILRTVLIVQFSHPSLQLCL